MFSKYPSKLHNIIIFSFFVCFFFNITLLTCTVIYISHVFFRVRFVKSPEKVYALLIIRFFILALVQPQTVTAMTVIMAGEVRRLLPACQIPGWGCCHQASRALTSQDSPHRQGEGWQIRLHQVI